MTDDATESNYTPHPTMDDVRHFRDVFARAAKDALDQGNATDYELYLDRAAVLTWVLGEIQMPVRELDIEGLDAQRPDDDEWPDVGVRGVG